MTLSLLFGTALSSPAEAAGPELRGPRWRADAAAQVQTADVSGDLRNPFTTGRGGVAAEHANDAGGSLRDPFGGRDGVAARRDDAPIAPASRARSRAATPIPAVEAPELSDPFRTRSAAPQPAPAGDRGSALRRPFGTP